MHRRRPLFILFDSPVIFIPEVVFVNVIPMGEVFRQDICVTDIVPTVRFHRENSRYSLISHPKQKHSLIYFHSCRGEYTTPEGLRLSAKPGDLVYIPKGYPYEVVFFDTAENAPGCVRVEFTLTDCHQRDLTLAEGIALCQAETSCHLAGILFEMASQYNAPVKPVLQIKALFCRALYQISTACHRSSLSRNEFAAISKGIHYIETDRDQLLSVEEIAEMCHVSVSFFRREFRRYSGQSPQEYRLSKRLERAKELLQGSEITVRQVAEELHFHNIYYFSRFFKERTGMSPAAYHRKYLSSQEDVKSPCP